MPTPRAARRALNHAVLVSTRSPSSISVPMVTISALSMFRPSRTLVFYNPPNGRPHAARNRGHLREREALGETLRQHPEGGRYGSEPGSISRPRPGAGASGRAPARRGEGDGARGVPAARGGV